MEAFTVENSRRNASPMLLRLFLLFTIVPLVELALLLWLASVTSWQFTLALVVVTGVVGAWLARQQGLRCWMRVHEATAAGQLPGDPLMDALMILVAGALLVTPGVLTDIVGFALLTPPFRRVMKNRLKKSFQSQIRVMHPGGAWTTGGSEAAEESENGTGDRIIETRVIDTTSEDAGDQP